MRRMLVVVLIRNTHIIPIPFFFLFFFHSHTLLFWIVTTTSEEPLGQSRLALLLSWKQYFYSVCSFGSLNWPDGSLVPVFRITVTLHTSFSLWLFWKKKSAKATSFFLFIYFIDVSLDSVKTKPTNKSILLQNFFPRLTWFIHMVTKLDL